MTIQRARELLGKRGNKYTDKHIQDIINMLVVISNIAIDQVIEKKLKLRSF